MDINLFATVIEDVYLFVEIQQHLDAFMENFE